MNELDTKVEYITLEVCFLIYKYISNYLDYEKVEHHFEGEIYTIDNGKIELAHVTLYGKMWFVCYKWIPLWRLPYNGNTMDEKLMDGHEFFSNPDEDRDDEQQKKGRLALEAIGFETASSDGFWIPKAYKTNPKDYYVHGDFLVEEGHLDEAITYYKKALELKTVYPEVYFSIGIVFDKKGHLDEAITYYRKAIEFKPDYTIAYSALGTVLMSKGFFNDAITYYRKAVELEPDNLIACSGLAVCLEKMKREHHNHPWTEKFYCKICGWDWDEPINSIWRSNGYCKHCYDLYYPT